MGPPPGGAPVAHRLGQRIWPMGLDSPVAGRAGTNQGLPGPKPRFCGACQAPDPGVLFARAKSTQKHAKTKVLEPFV